MVFLHGWGGNISSFKPIADRLSDTFTVTLIDMYGFGNTPHPNRPLVLDDYVKGVQEVLERCGVESALVVGHSFGGRVAMRLASSSSLVTGLVLTDSAGVPPRRGLSYRIKVASYKLRKRLGLDTSKFGSADYLQLSDVMKKTFVNIVNESNLPDAEKITQPTLLVWGEKDAETPLYMCRKLKSKITSSDCVIFKDSGHFAYLQNLDAFCAILRSFGASL